MSIRLYEFKQNQHWSNTIKLDAADCEKRKERKPVNSQRCDNHSDCKRSDSIEGGGGSSVGPFQTDPSSKHRELCSISGVCVALLLLLCPGIPGVVDGTRIPIENYWKSMSLSALRQNGEKTLKHGNVVPRQLDAIEFSVVHQGPEDYVMLQYNLGFNSSPWVTITPCTGQLNRIKFSPSATQYQPSHEEFKFGLQLTSSNRDRVEPLWKAGSIWVEPFPGEQNPPPKYTLSPDETELHNLDRSRVQYSRTVYRKDTMNIRLYGRVGDAYAVRVSTRSSPTHVYDGYPVPARSPYISVCVEDQHENHLEIRWNPALTDSMRPTYCVAINARENMPYRCTAMARLRPHNASQFERPLVFQETDHLRAKLIEPSVYECVNETRIRVKLPRQLADLVTSTRGTRITVKRLYVNVYAINPRTDLSTAYAASVLPLPIGSCQSVRRMSTTVSVRVHPPLTYVAWNADVIFQWPENIPSAQLYFQPCQLAKSSEHYYTVHLYERQQLSHLPERELCKHNVTTSSHVFPVCDRLFPGNYRFYMDGSAGFKSGQHMARLFFFNTTANILPKRPETVELTTRLSSILTVRTIEPVHSQAKQLIGLGPAGFPSANNTIGTRHIMNIDETQLIRRPQRHLSSNHTGRTIRLRQYTVDWRDRRLPSTFAESAPIIDQRQTRQTRTLPVPNGLGVGVDCNKHQIFITVAIHPEPHYYWIYMFPVSPDLERLQEVTNYCEFPVAAFRWIKPHQVRRPVICRTYAGQPNMTLFTPAYDRADYPRHYLLLIYAAHGEDPLGHYRQLFVQAVIDACMLTVDSCYHKRPTSCSLSYPDHYPSSFDHVRQGFSLFKSTTSLQPQCSFG